MKSATGFSDDQRRWKTVRVDAQTTKFWLFRVSPSDQINMNTITHVCWDPANHDCIALCDELGYFKYWNTCLDKQAQFHLDLANQEIVSNEENASIWKPWTKFKFLPLPHSQMFLFHQIGSSQILSSMVQLTPSPSVEQPDGAAVSLIAQCEFPILCFDIGLQGEFLCAGSSDGSVYVWHLNTDHPADLRLETAHKGKVTAISAMVNAVVTGGEDQCVKVWDLSNINGGQKLATFVAESSSISTFHTLIVKKEKYDFPLNIKDDCIQSKRVPQKRQDAKEDRQEEDQQKEEDQQEEEEDQEEEEEELLIAGTVEGTVYIWSLTKMFLLDIIQQHTSDILCISSPSNGEALAVGDLNGKMMFHCTSTFQPLGTHFLHSPVVCCSFNEFDEFLACTYTGDVKLWPSTQIKLPHNSGSTASVPIGSVPIGSVPIGSVPIGSVPIGSVPTDSVPHSVKGDVKRQVISDDQAEDCCNSPTPRTVIPQPTASNRQRSNDETSTKLISERKKEDETKLSSQPLKSKKRTQIPPPQLFQNITKRMNKARENMNLLKVNAIIEKHENEQKMSSADDIVTVNDQSGIDISTSLSQPKLNSTKWIQKRLDQLQNEHFNEETAKVIAQKVDKPLKSAVNRKILTVPSAQRQYSNLTSVHENQSEVLIQSKVKEVACRPNYKASAAEDGRNDKWRKQKENKPKINDFMRDNNLESQIRCKKRSASNLPTITKYESTELEIESFCIPLHWKYWQLSY